METSNFETLGHITGRLRAKADWLQGELFNPFPRGSEAWYGYELEKRQIELDIDRNEFLAGRMGV